MQLTVPFTLSGIVKLAIVALFMGNTPFKNFSEVSHLLVMSINLLLLFYFVFFLNLYQYMGVYYEASAYRLKFNIKTYKATNFQLSVQLLKKYFEIQSNN